MQPPVLPPPLPPVLPPLLPPLLLCPRMLQENACLDGWRLRHLVS